MSWTEYTAVNFGLGKAGLTTVGYRLYNSGGSALAARITAGIVERTPGVYAASVVFPDTFVGELRWDSGEVTPIYASNFVNPRDGENLDAKISSIVASGGSGSGSGAFTVTVTVTDGASPLENATVRLVEGAQNLVVKTNVSGVATFALDAATYSVAIVKPGYQFTPDTIVVIGAGNFNKVMSLMTPPPPFDTTLCRVFGSFETIDNRPLANVLVTFTLIAPDPIRSERMIAGRQVKVRTDSIGQLVNKDGEPWVELQRNDEMTPSGTTYRVNAPALEINDEAVTLAQATFDLATLAT